MGCVTALAAGASVLPAGCERSVSRKAVLQSLVQHLALPDAAAIVRETKALESALAQLEREASATSLQSARTTLQHALIAWQRAYAFRHGPIEDSRALMHAAFWPIRSSAVEHLVTGPQSIDDAFVSELGVDSKGLFALEHLLFAEPTPNTTWMLGTVSTRACALASALARDVSRHAERVAHDLARGDFQRNFANAGQDSLNQVVNQMLATLETIAADRLGRIASMRSNQRFEMRDVQGAESGLSVDIPLAWLTTTQRVYLGLERESLATLVKQVAPQVDVQVRAVFAGATAALQALPKRLDDSDVATTHALEAAILSIKDLEVALKVDVASALGVTLSFISSDGD